MVLRVECLRGLAIALVLVLVPHAVGLVSGNGGHMLLPRFLRPLPVNHVWGFLAVISYSLYLVQLPTLWYGRHYASIERPILRLKRRVAG